MFLYDLIVSIDLTTVLCFAEHMEGELYRRDNDATHGFDRNPRPLRRVIEHGEQSLAIHASLTSAAGRCLSLFKCIL